MFDAGPLPAMRGDESAIKRMIFEKIIEEAYSD
jgi:hypothetical protein